MRKYKAGDKVVLDVLSNDDDGWYKIGGEYYSWWENPNYLDKVSEPLSEYTEKLEKKNENKQKRIEKLVERLHRQAAEITRLLQENEDLKNSIEIIRDNSFEAGMIKGHEEAWELVQKITWPEQDGGYSMAELKKIFDSPYLSEIFSLTYAEAAAKVAEWERQKEICVGDVLLSINTHDKCIVTYIRNKTITMLWGDGSSGNRSENLIRKEFEKVGHIDVDAWLAQIGGEE